MIDNLIPAIPVPVMPESYDLSMSYMELLMTCVNKLNAMIKLVNDETVAMNEVKEQINQILPYLDDLAHMGERFAAIQAEIDALRDELYDETNGDIVAIRAALEAINATINSIQAKLSEAYAQTLQNKVAAGTNVLNEVWHTSGVTHRGITITYSEATGWYHLTGTLSAGQGSTTEVQIARYALKEPFKTILNQMDELTPAYVTTGRFWAKSLVSPDTVNRYSQLLWFVFGENEYVFDGVNSTELLRFSGNEMTLKVKFTPSAVNVAMDLWICPAMDFVPSMYDNDPEYYPTPSNANTAVELRDRIITETANRIEADANEAQARADAFSQLSERIRQEGEARVAQDYELATAIDDETTARIAGDKAAAIACLSPGTEIPENGDLNALSTNPDVAITAGKFWFSSANVATIQNLPVTPNAAISGSVTNDNIYGTNRFLQTMTFNIGTGAYAHRIFKRWYTSAGWSNWFEVTMTEIVPTPSPD